MKKKLSMLLAVGLLVSGITACGVKSEGSQANANEIKIGINYELSGGVASYGQSSVDGIMLAIDEINAAGGIDGKKLVPVKYDNKSEPAEAVILANKLISQDKVLAILGPATSGSFKSEVSVAEKKKVPVISGSATADDVTVDKTGKKDYAFRICYTDSFQGTAMANFASQNLSAKKAVIVKDSSSDYAKGLAENFIKTFKDAGGTIVGEEAYVAKDKDFNAILTKIKDLDFDVIYLPGYYEEAGLIIKQARALGIDKPILGADGFDSPDLTSLAGAGALSKVYFTNHYSSLDKDPTVIKFIDDFKKKYNKEPNAFHALGYDLAKFLADGIKRSKSLDSEALKEALASTTDFTGVTGSFSIDENHNPVKAIVIVGLENGVQATAVRSGK
ncbi:leucine-, isoleucine-, valine-, threonine-, and alanine-binding protein precursor [Ruminiclostridium hungatei]|uniref:Leucine-, isoleucine-, valine-, threonine-, and alanine-binding protein n=1 Tax=Ruminiclostridium hungatei TaxID=48256 RepID=A0A1V4SF62_RUMHU|nr:ABC transporter substrate-binding protein [Ruminiclostridium hungatei]OPX42529.1 leucine-, isoleucine-, valine-, threonine-, and alanine-binding protein precursor [Ruminiclostridium hungatei]